MNHLKELLNLTKLKTINEIEQQFYKIAYELFQNYHIQKRNVIYDFLEIEFYYYCKEHKDIITYPRNAQSGDWFFHNSGLDLSFESKLNIINTKITEDSYFGGVLIRSLRKRKISGQCNDEYIVGPIRCANELFNQFSAINYDEKQYPQITTKGQSNYRLSKKTRWIKYKEKTTKFQILNKKYILPITENHFYEYYENKEYRYYNSSIDLKDLKNYQANPWKK